MMDLDWFIKEYNKSDYEGRATKRHVEAFLTDQGCDLDQWDRNEFDRIAREYEAHKDYILIQMDNSKKAGKVEQPRAGIPYSSNWYRLEKCELKEFKPTAERPIEPSVRVRRVSSKKQVEWPPRYWVFEFGGECEKYEPTNETLKDALSIPLPPDSGFEPPEEALRFFRKWGPMGLFFVACERVYGGEELWGDVELTRDIGPYESMLQARDRMPYEDYWFRFYHSKTKPFLPFGASGALFNGYFEHWFLLFHELSNLQRSFNNWFNPKYHGECEFDINIHDINHNVANHLHPHLLRQDDGTIHWAFHFSTLRDAMYSLIAQEVVTGRTCSYCKNCDKPFFQIHGHQVHCCSKCRQSYADKRRTKKKAEQAGRA